MKRYTIKRGRRAACEYDVIIRDGKEVVFGGSFFPLGLRKLTAEEIAIIDAIRVAVAARG